MANRSFNRLQALDKEIKIIHGQFAVGASGATATEAIYVDGDKDGKVSG